MVSVRGGVSNGCGYVGGDILVLGKAVVVVMVIPMMIVVM